MKSAVQLTRVRTRWCSRYGSRQLRSSKALSNFWQLKVLNWLLFIAGWLPYTGKTVCPTSQWKNGVPVFVQAAKVWLMTSRPVQTNTVTTVDLIHKVDDLVRSDCHFTLRMLVEKVDVSVGTMWTIVHERLRFRKVYAQWISKRLTDQQKELSMGIALQQLFRYHEDLTFLERQLVRCCSPSFSSSKVHYSWTPRAQRNHYLRCVL